jgi:YVTN family beta-propeller protein
MRKLGFFLFLALLLPCSYTATSSFAQGHNGAPPGRYLAVSLFDARAVEVRSLPSLVMTDRIKPKFRPVQLTPLNGTGRLYIFPAFDDVNDVFVDYDVGAGKPIARIRAQTPFTGQLNEDGAKLYVTNLESGGVVVVHTANDEVFGSLITTPRPDYMDLDAFRRELYVADNSNGKLTVYDTLTDQSVRQFNAGAIQQVSVAMSKVYWSTGSSVVLVNDALTFTPLRFLETGDNVLRLRASADRTRIWALSLDIAAGTGILTAINTADDSVVASYPFTGYATDFVINEAEDTAYLPLFIQDALGLLDLVSGAFSSMPVGKSPISVALVEVPGTAGF